MKHHQLLSIDTNPKTVKGQRFGYMTGVLYLAPADLSGYQVCPMAETAACKDPCLNKAGRGAFDSVQLARIAKTRRFFENRDGFMLDLIYSITQLVRKAKKASLVPLVRLNGTSDIRWETIKVLDTGKNIFELFPDIQFYDYTKIPNRKGLPANYDLTFSYSGVIEFRPAVEKALASGLRVAVVFRDKNKIPETFEGLPVVNGDDSDLRPLDAQGVIVGLYAKGRAKKDQSGFVIDSAGVI